jgi:hypothetical protein
MINTTNTNRAAWAASALRHFQKLTGTDYKDSLGDLLCDLMHWADARNFDFDAALCRASDHYKAEVAESREEALQSAASDLFAALKLCEDALSELARLDDGTLSISALNAARKAIAKVEGGVR